MIGRTIVVVVVFFDVHTRTTIEIKLIDAYHYANELRERRSFYLASVAVS